MHLSLLIIIPSLLFFNSDPDNQTAKILKFSVLYDNYVSLPGTEAEWGFSCLIESNGKRILFDTGTKEKILLANAQKIDVELVNLDAIVLSHEHHDHTGGIDPLLELNPGVSVYVLPSFSTDFIQKLKTQKADVISVPERKLIFDKIFLTGEMGQSIKEQSLYIETDQGIIVVTGCSHQGIVNIVKKVKNATHKDIHLVFGGFHLLRHSDQQIEEIIKQFQQLGIQRCGPTHCTGDRAIALFKEAYQDNYIPMGTGKIIEIK